MTTQEHRPTLRYALQESDSGTTILFQDEYLPSIEELLGASREHFPHTPSTDILLFGAETGFMVLGMRVGTGAPAAPKLSVRGDDYDREFSFEDDDLIPLAALISAGKETFPGASLDEIIVYGTFDEGYSYVGAERRPPPDDTPIVAATVGPTHHDLALGAHDGRRVHVTYPNGLTEQLYIGDSETLPITPQELIGLTRGAALGMCQALEAATWRHVVPISS